MKLRYPHFISILFCFLLVQAQAQSNKVTNDPDAAFKQAKEMIQQEKYSLAYPLFKYVVDQAAASAIPATVQIEAQYYAIICGLQLNDPSAVVQAVDFINLEHHEPRIEMMCYHLGNYYYRQQDFSSAITYYEQAGIENLNNAEIAQMKFQQGYALFSLQRINEAKPLFDDIRQMQNDKNYAAANYYFGFISLGEKNYNQALAAFKIIEQLPEYSPVISYYIAEVYYYTGKKDEALSYTEAALQRGNQYYDLSMRQLAGHLYFEKGNYIKAKPYLETYISKTAKVSRQDLYELSFCYYDAAQYDKAIQGFKELGGKQDTLAQHSMYLLADSYLKTGNKPGARSAFLFCALNSSNGQQKEVSKFNYGKLSYELGFTDIALNELKEFSTTYPRSFYTNEAKELLVNVLARTNNYNEALTLLESLPVKTDMVNKIYPKVLYGRAMEYINDQQLNKAELLFNKIYTLQYNAEQIPFTNFWKGELAFRNNIYDSSIIYMQRYMQEPVSYGEVSPSNARYTLGYSHLRQLDYTQALNYFEQVSKTISTGSNSVQADAYLRSADCYFMQKKLSTALSMYQNFAATNLPGSDYAYYQKAIIAGASDNANQKLELLQALQQKYPSSALIGDANMEVANTYLTEEKYQQAIAPLNSVIQSKNQEALKPQAYLKLGISYYNLNDNTKALDHFKKLVSSYPASTESDEAVEYVKDIFIEQQQPDAYIAFMKQNGKNVSYNEQDSLTYIAAYNAYKEKQIDNALNGFKYYLSKFPEGRYAADAAYISATVYNQQKAFDAALNYYKLAIEKTASPYAEPATLQTARIYFFEKADYINAEKYFTELKAIAASPENRLESMRGLLRSQYKLNKMSEAVPNAQELLQQKGIATDDKMMANLIIAKDKQAAQNYSDALIGYKAVVALGKSEFAAEARYRIAEINFIQSKFADAENAAFDVISKSGSYDFWITKSYILLGDIYYKQKDYFNAEATLKSVVENATIEALKEEAKSKLDIVIQEKDKNSKIETN